MSRSLTISLFLCCFTALVSNTSYGQSIKDQKIVYIHAGSSLFGGAMHLLIGNGDEIDTDTTNGFAEIKNSSVSGGRALVLGFEYNTSSRWSIGGFVSTQRRHGSTEFSFLDQNNSVQTETVTFNLRRNSIGFAAKVHYGNGERIDLYSGARMGYLFWNKQIESTSGKFDMFDDLTKSRALFGLTAFGARVYPVENIGLNFELNLGAPNIIGLGAVIKLP